MNKAIGGNGLLQARLVFGISPRFSTLSADLPNQKGHMEAIKSAQAEMVSLVAEGRISEALKKLSHLPPITIIN